MKRFWIVLLALCFLLPAFAGCSSGVLTEDTLPGTENTAETEKAARSVLAPMTERPNYVLHEGATADEMRAMAVKAMRDELTIVWFPDQDVNYQFTFAVGGNSWQFQLSPFENYAGLPYSGARVSLFHFLHLSQKIPILTNG